jgi:hypothetical protein
MSETQEHPPHTLKTSMADPWEAVVEIRDRPPPILKMSMAGPLGGDVRDPGAPTTYPEDVDGGSPKRRCWRHYVKKIKYETIM